MTHSDTQKTADESPRPGDVAELGDKKRKTLNLPFLLGTLALAAILAGAAYAWRSYRVTRMARELVKKAEALEKEGDSETAAKYLRQYLGLRPHDADGLARLAGVYDRPKQPAAEKARAVEIYYRAIGALGDDGSANERQRLRLRLAKLLLELSPLYRGSSTRAEREARFLLEPTDKAEAWQRLRAEDPSLPPTVPEDEHWWMAHPEVWTDAQGARLWMLAVDRQIKDGSFAGGALPDLPFDRHFEQTLKLNPGDIELSTVLARLYRDKPELFAGNKPGLSDDERRQLADRRQSRADAIENAMVAANPKSPQAFLARYQYRVDYGLPGAADDLKKALEYGPEDAAVLLAAAWHARREAARLRKEQAQSAEAEAKYAEAADFCRRAIRAAPSDEAGYLLLGEVCRAQGRNDEAIDVWRQGLEKCGQESLTLNSRLMEALVADGRLEEARKHLDAVNREAGRLGPQLERGSQLVLSGLNGLLRGEWLVGQGRYAEAVTLLKRVTAGRQDSDLGLAQVWQAWQLLGGVYAQLGQWDLAATAHEAAARLEPEDRPPEARVRTLLAAANAWTMAGRPDEAAADCQEAADLDDAPETWLALAAARLQHQRGLPPEERAWDDFDEAFSKAKAGEKSLAEPWRLALVEADALVAKSQGSGPSEQAVRSDRIHAVSGSIGKGATPDKSGHYEPLDEAARLLRQAEKKYPDSETLLEALVGAYEALGLPADADRAMDAVDRLGGQSAAVCLLRSRLYLRRRQYDKAREVLAGGLKTVGPAARTKLRLELVQVDLDQGELEAARRRLEELHQNSPTDLRFVWQLGELALELNDLKEAAHWENELRKLEGPNGSYWRYVKGRRLLAEVQDANDPRLAEVGQLQTYLQSQRRAWPEGYVLAGLRYERLGRFEQAIAAYQQAIERGEARVSVYQRLVGLLYRKRDLDQARRYLAFLEDYVPSSQALSGMEISVAAQLGDNARALEAARRGVKSRPENPTARIWLGRMLLRNGQTKEAEAALLEASRLASDDPRTADALFAFYADTGQKDRATDALKRLAASREFSQADRLLVLAKGYERLGDTELAKKYYAEAAQQPVDNLASQKRLAAFLFESDPQGAEEALRRALRLAPGDREVRRALAYLLAARGGAREWQEVQRLMAHGGRDADVSSQDRRLEAQLLVRRGGKENLAKAKQLLEELIHDPDAATPVDHLLLAGIYDRQGKTYLAEKQYEIVAQRPEPEPAHVMAYVDFLLRHERLHEAERGIDKLDGLLVKWLARLHRQAPAQAIAVGTRARLDAVRLRARWLKAEGKPDEIKPLVDGVAEKLLTQAADDSDQEASVYSGVGDLYSAVGEEREAETWCRRLADLQPDSYEPLVTCMARQGRVKEAIERCIKVAETDDSPRPAIVLAKMLGTVRPTADDFEAAEPLLAKAVAGHPDDVELLSIVAYVRFLQKRNDEAVRLYERVLSKKPQDLLVLNNLATLLTEQPSRRKDALDYIQKAIAIAGPKPNFLDVKGTILALDGKANEAVPLLEEASSLSADPRYAFHLALAYERSGNVDMAREALTKANEGDLKGQALTETDKRLLVGLEEQLAR